MLYYTGAVQPNAIQTNPSKSLGGYISSSQVENGVINNLFYDYGYTVISQNTKQIRVISFYNYTGNEIPEFKLHVNSGSENCSKLKIGLILSSVDEECNVQYFETISSENGTPYFVQLRECEGMTNALVLNNIPVGRYVGIFIQRELIPEKNPDIGGTPKNCDDFYNQYQMNPNIPAETVQKDSFDIVLNF